MGTSSESFTRFICSLQNVKQQKSNRWHLICKTLAVSLTHPSITVSHSDISLVWVMLHKQKQLHHWRANHLGSSRTLRKSQGPTVLGCAALLKGGGGKEGRDERGMDNRQAANSITSSLQQPAPNARQPGGTERAEWVKSIYQLSPSSPWATVQQDASALPICSQHC